MSGKKGVISSRSKEYWINKGYSEKESIKLARSRMPGTIEYYNIFKGFDINESKVKAKQYQSNRAITLKNYIKKYGEIDGKKRFDEYREKQALTNTFEYKRDKYGWTREQFNEYNKSRGSLGELNPNYKIGYYKVWVNKYGKEKADEMNAELGPLKAIGGKKQKGIPKSDEHCQAMRKPKRGIKPKSDETKKNMRLAAIKRIEKNKYNGDK